MSDEAILTIEALKADVAAEELGILKALNLQVRKGEVHAIMGPNGSGKSTLAKVLMGHPGYRPTGGRAIFDGSDLLAMEPHDRARAGMFLAFQYPVEVPGVSIANFLRTSMQSRLKEGDDLDLFDFQDLLLDRMKLLEMEPSFAERSVNDGFSGGEKKRNEILQMAVLKPKLVLMDETDSGLDIDALKVVASGVNTLRQEDPDMAIVLITHYQRILDYITPDVVHVMVDGRIVRSGGPEVALWLEEEGYASWREVEEQAAAI
jgi:Fe-S cluster assembly ATP-binding protein